MSHKETNTQRTLETRGFSLPAFIFSVSLCLCALIFAQTIGAQNYPKEIRGYKVQQTKITVKNKTEKAGAKEDSEAFVTVSQPTVEEIFLTGVTLEVAAEISALEQSGKVDFMTFKDFRVNGLEVDIQEYGYSFSFEKNQPIALPKPVRIFVGTGQSLLGALNEVRGSKDEWDVTGTIFVFGKFKKWGFNFKRVVPVPINIKIKNPLRNRG